MFVILGASGNTGSVAASSLLQQGKAVRVVAHNAAKAQALKDRGAEVAVADLEDRAALEKAFHGAEAAYVLLPPAFASSQVRVDNGRRAKNIAAALQAAGVQRVVLLSSIGAQHPDGTGPILGLYDAEAILGAIVSPSGRTRSLTCLRPAYFMENWGMSLAGMANGVLPTFLTADRAIPMVATHDIGLAAARLLAEDGSGKRFVQLAGPREYSPIDIAAALGRVIGKPVSAQLIPEAAMPPALAAVGMNAEWARLFQELTHGINTGRIDWEQSHPVSRGETSIDSVLSSLVSKSA